MGRISTQTQLNIVAINTLIMSQKFVHIYRKYKMNH